MSETNYLLIMYTLATYKDKTDKYIIWPDYAHMLNCLILNKPISSPFGVVALDNDLVKSC